MRNLYIISINHQTHCAEERIKLDLSTEAWEELFAFLTFKLGAEGFVLLRTCNRIELYYEADQNWTSRIKEKWNSLVSSTQNFEGMESVQTYDGYRACIEHLLQLSVGFKSAIYGDDQILSQLKKAFEQARSNKSMSTLLERSYQSVMRFHKKVCRDTDFKSHTISLAYQALKSARFSLGSDRLAEKNVLIIGAGDMAAQVVKYLPKFKFGSISITNRTQSKAKRLVQNKKITVVAYEQLEIKSYDIIISCTDQGYSLLSNWSNVDYYIDLSLHSASIGPISTSHIVLAELQQSINERNVDRMKSVGRVYEILENRVEGFEGWCSRWHERSARVSAL
ncbi:MAG: hypothetical protein AAGA77_17485 [Bacteroidota bacterium]